MCERYDYILQCGYGQVTQSRIGCVTRSDDNVPILCIQWSIPRLFFTLCKQLLHNKMLLSLAGFEFRLSKLKVSMLTTRRNTTARMLRIAITQGRSGGHCYHLLLQPYKFESCPVYKLLEKNENNQKETGADGPLKEIV